MASAALLALTDPALGADAPSSVVSKPPGSAQGIALRLPPDEFAVYHGIALADNASVQMGQVMYSGPYAVGVLAQVVAHGLMVDAKRDARRQRMEDEADRVLLPYRYLLNHLTQSELLQRASKLMSTSGTRRVVGNSEGTGADLVIESTPVFYMSQDQMAIVLDAEIAIFWPEKAAAAQVYKNRVRVVSGATAKSNLLDYWTADEGETLKALSARLLAESMELALDDQQRKPGTSPARQKTVRYRLGVSERMERGEVVASDCGRILLRTLRGWLMSVPSSISGGADSNAPLCPPQGTRDPAPTLQQ